MVTVINYPSLGIKLGEVNRSVISSNALSVTLLNIQLLSSLIKSLYHCSCGLALRKNRTI